MKNSKNLISVSLSPSISDLRKQLKSTPKPHELSEPMSTAVAAYYKTMRGGVSASTISKSGVKQHSRTSSGPEQKVLAVEDILPDTFDSLEKKAQKVFYIYKLLSRAKTYEERRVAELYYFDRKTYAEIAGDFTAHDRESINVAESKTVSSKTIQNRLKGLLKHADLKNDVSFGTEEEMHAFIDTGKHPTGANRFVIHNKHNDIYNFMMLCPTARELKDLHRYFYSYFKTTVAEDDAENNFTEYCNNINNISEYFLVKSFEMEYVFSHFAKNDLDSLYYGLERLFNMVSEIINKIVPSILPNSAQAK